MPRLTTLHHAVHAPVPVPITTPIAAPPPLTVWPVLQAHTHVHKSAVSQLVAGRQHLARRRG